MMEGAFAVIPAALLILACPLMMVGMGVGAWFVARLRGEKRSLSMGCMPHGAHELAAPEPEGAGVTAAPKGPTPASDGRRASVGSL